MLQDEAGRSPDHRLAQFALVGFVGGIIGFVLGAGNRVPATQTPVCEAGSFSVTSTSDSIALRSTVDDASTLDSRAADKPLGTMLVPPQLIPSDTTPPLGGAIHEYLRERDFVVHEANRETGIVEWQNADKALSVVGHFGTGSNPIFDRKVLQLVVNERGNPVLSAERVAMHDGTVVVGTANSWQPLLPEISVTKRRSGAAYPQVSTVTDAVAGTELVNGWRVKVAPLPESTRRRICYELCHLQDTGTDDQKAYSIMAKRYGIDEDMVYAVAGEGAVKQWPLPPAP